MQLRSSSGSRGQQRGHERGLELGNRALQTCLFRARLFRKLGIVKQKRAREPARARFRIYEAGRHFDDRLQTAMFPPSSASLLPSRSVGRVGERIVLPR
jgi:hypothetical protein